MVADSASIWLKSGGKLSTAKLCLSVQRTLGFLCAEKMVDDTVGCGIKLSDRFEFMLALNAVRCVGRSVEPLESNLDATLQAVAECACIHTL
jgi:hypothetical protein